MSKKVLVIASGGIDSGITTALLKLHNYDVEMVHFIYGQRSWLPELWSAYKISKYYKVPLKVINLESLYQEMNASSISFLMNSKSKVYSGLKQLKKSVSAWVPGRNMLFGTITASYAESLMLHDSSIDEIYIASGWAQLSESGSYPDNSERFNESLENLFKFGLIEGHNIHIINLLANIMKYEEWIIGESIHFPFEYTCSCDNPRIIWSDEVGTDIKTTQNYKELKSAIYDLNSIEYFIKGIELCVECGSTKNSRWAAKYAGIKDPRKFYVSKQMPKGYDSYEIDVKPKFTTKQAREKELKNIMNRVQFPY